MDVVERFATLVSSPPNAVPLDETAFLLAAHVRAPLDVPSALARLDELAEGCATPTFDALRAQLFDRYGLRGNAAHYDDPDNSFLDRVLERRLGIPISLSVIVIEVGRRLGLAVVGIGMPAHFLVGVAGTDVYCDPFGGGRVLDRAGCAALFEQLTQGQRSFDPAFLAPVDARQILSRMCLNLEHGPLGGDSQRLNAVLDLHARIPGLGAADRVAVASKLATVGRYLEGARLLEDDTDELPQADELARHARALRARLN
jgi:regulator of sirC expression with transglutaminase-like and TPR domain